MTHSITSDCI